MTKIANDLARILVAAARSGDAEQIAQSLRDEFADVRATTDPDRIAADFRACEPDVVVLAFETLSGARAYYRVLDKSSVPQPEHRTLILCSRVECATVVEACRQGEFDDYVLYWPQPYDGFRLAMSIRIACRAMAVPGPQRSLPLGLFGQARHVDELDRNLDAELDDADRRTLELRQSLASTEREIVRVVDDLSGRLATEASAGWIDVKDRDLLAGEFDLLKEQQVDAVRRHGELEIASMRARATRLKDRLEPSLAGARSLVEELRKHRPVVLVVEDDEFSRELVARTLDAECWEAIFASDGASAISQLRQVRPDVILMDIRLPDTDGLSLTHQLKASPHLSAIPVIMMTGDAREETLLSSLAAGASGFVVKPFTRAVLTAKLEKLFAR